MHSTKTSKYKVWYQWLPECMRVLSTSAEWLVENLKLSKWLEGIKQLSDLVSSFFFLSLITFYYISINLLQWFFKLLLLLLLLLFYFSALPDKYLQWLIFWVLLIINPNLQSIFRLYDHM